MIELKNIHKTYRMGDNLVQALRGVSLTIEPGEFVAIIGPSGSGKSTLMHVIGLLDVPDQGVYMLNGRDVSRLNDDDLAIVRREEIGFIFQQFHLLPRTSAVENVSLPLLYSRQQRDTTAAKQLLTRVGLGNRADHRPNELSGGQQQRVAIARALVNQPRLLLADEPTGNLDSKSQDEILEILRELNRQGITVIIVTHEPEIAQAAPRRIFMRDGVVQSDERSAASASERSATASNVGESSGAAKEITRDVQKSRALPFIEHARQGLRALAANKLRTALSMLGILIGVAAVLAMLALGAGARESIERQLSALGSNLLVLRSGAVRVAGVRQEAGTTTRLTPDDAKAIQEIAGVRQVGPSVSGRARATFRNRNWNTQIVGVTPNYSSMRAAEPTLGRFFTEEENRRRARVALVGMTLVRELFGGENPVGQLIKVNRVNFEVIGVLPEKGANAYRDQDDVVLVPLFTTMYRVLGRTYVDSIDIEAENPQAIEPVKQAVNDLMIARQRVPPSQREGAFRISNLADVQNALEESGKTMSYLLASIAAISLLVGGIGIMNIMLVSVTERTREIGLRKAVGARSRDILAQFLIETVVVSAIGGLAGVALGGIVAMVMSSVADWTVAMTPESIVLALVFSAALGIVFGIYPARRAAALHPIEALRYE